MKKCKLKCWRKTGETSSGSISYRKIGKDKVAGVLRIMNNPKGRPWSFNNDGNVSKNFKSRIQAIKFANKYMKEHDKC